ncbi:MAG: FliM/FliN family flagellar motor switch protein [Terracidiphilus sp.]
MNHFLECWIRVASALFAQALAGEPELVDAPSGVAAEDTLEFVYALSGDEKGHFTVLLDTKVFQSPLMGEGVDQKAAWGELLREVADSAVGELLARTGRKCRIDATSQVSSAKAASRSLQLKSPQGAWVIRVTDQTEVQAKGDEVAAPRPSGQSSKSCAETETSMGNSGFELLFDVELEATLRFGCRELPLSEILELGPGDVVELDRHVADPVDLIVADKIVARGEVVLINGNFGLRVTQVAAPRKRLESIRCLF